VRYMTLAGIVFAVYVAGLGAADTPKATATREKLKQKVTVDYKDELFRNVIEDLPEQVKGLRIKPDVKGGVSQNRKITYKAKDKPLDEVLADILKEQGWGYFVITNDKDTQWDGALYIKVGKERGYEEGKEPDKTTVKKEEPEKKPAKPEPEKKPVAKEKPEPKEKPAVKPEPKEEPKPKTEDSDDEKAERLANIGLKAAKGYVTDGKTEDAKEECERIIKKYPKTKAAEEAKKLLQKLS
jgi:hypothetical protein